MICPACGKRTTHTVEDYSYRECGLQNVLVSRVDIYRCVCGEEYVQLPGAQEVHNQIAEAILNKDSLLLGAEAKFLRKWLHLTSEDLAKALGYTRVTVSRWENQDVPDTADRALRLYASSVGNISVDFPKLFASLSPQPNKDFKIIVGDKPLYVAAAAVSAPKSPEHDFLDDFSKSFHLGKDAGNQELALAA